MWSIIRPHALCGIFPARLKNPAIRSTLLEAGKAGGRLYGPHNRRSRSRSGFLKSAAGRMRRDTTTEKLASRVEGEGCEVAKRPPPFPRDIKRDLPPPPNGASIKILSSNPLNIWSNFCTNISVHEIMI